MEPVIVARMIVVIAERPVFIDLGDAVFLVHIEHVIFFCAGDLVLGRGMNHALGIDAHRVAAIANHVERAVDQIDIDRLVSGERVVLHRLAIFELIILMRCRNERNRRAKDGQTHAGQTDFVRHNIPFLLI